MIDAPAVGLIDMKQVAALPESGFTDDLLAALPEPDDGPVLTLADLYFEARLQATLACNLDQSPTDRHRAAVASAIAYSRFEGRVRALGGRWVCLSLPFVMVRWDGAGLEYLKPVRAGQYVVSRPRAQAVPA